MLSKLLIFAVLGACSASFFSSWKNEVKTFSHVKNVERFSVDLPGLRAQVDSKIPPFGQKAQNVLGSLHSSLLLHGVPLGLLKAGQTIPFIGLQSDRKLKLASYNIANCTSPSPDKAKFVIKSLTISPDPVEIPGTFTISFDIDVLTDIPSAEVKVDMEFKRGSTTVKIPCIGEEIGSCDYKDICSLLSQVQSCPPEFDAAKIPCKCPFNKGFYKLPGISVEIDAEVLETGDYTITANGSFGGDFLGCYIVNFSISA